MGITSLPSIIHTGFSNRESGVTEDSERDALGTVCGETPQPRPPNQTPHRVPSRVFYSAIRQMMLVADSGGMLARFCWETMSWRVWNPLGRDAPHVTSL